MFNDVNDVNLWAFNIEGILCNMNLLKKISTGILLSLIGISHVSAIDVFTLNDPDAENMDGAELSGVKDSYIGWVGETNVLKSWQLALTVTPKSAASVTPQLDFFWTSRHLYQPTTYRNKGVVVSITSDFKLIIEHGDSIIKSSDSWLEDGKETDLTLRFELLEDIEGNPFQGVFSVSSSDKSFSLLISDEESLEYFYLNNKNIGNFKWYPYITSGANDMNIKI